MPCRKRKNRPPLHTLAIAIAAALSCAPLGAVAAPGATMPDAWAEARPWAQADARFSRLERIDEGEMAQLRGGLSIGGIEMDFGATLRTLIDNIQLTTAYRISEAGVQVLSETLGTVSAVDAARGTNHTASVSMPVAGVRGLSIPISIARSAMPVQIGTGGAGAASTIAGTPATATLVGPSAGHGVTDVAAPGVSLAGVQNYRGVVVNDVKGFTAALHDITRQAVTSALINTASDRKISQRLEIDVRLQNIGQIRAAAIRSAVAQRLNR